MAGRIRLVKKPASGEFTREHMTERVEYWRLRLGLNEWRVDVRWDDPPNPNCLASIGVPHQTFDARLYLDENWPKWTIQQMDETLVHELLHLALRDLERAADSAGDALGKEAQALWEERYDHEQEVLIERLANLIASF